MSSNTRGGALRDVTADTAVLDTVQTMLDERISRGQLDIPILPEVAMQIVTLTSDPDVDAHRLSAIVHRDPALASHVLCIANSPLFMPGVPIVSLRQAVARLGIRQLAQVALAASIKATAFSARGFKPLVERMRIEATTCGAWSREIARHVRKNTETAFLCGLVHRVGGPVVLQAIYDIAKELDQTVDEVDALLLLRLYGAPVGAAVAQKWGLPDVVRAVIASGGDTRFNEKHRDAIAITRAARTFGEHVGKEAEGLPHHRCFELLDLYPEDVQKLLGRADAVADFATAMEG